MMSKARCLQSSPQPQSVPASTAPRLRRNQPKASTSATAVRRERRRHLRAELIGIADVSGRAGEEQVCEVENLSAGGALLNGTATLRAGDTVRVVLHVCGLAAMHASARVVWSAREGARCRSGLAFVDLAAADQDLIQDAVLEALYGPASGPR